MASGGAQHGPWTRDVIKVIFVGAIASMVFGAQFVLGFAVGLGAALADGTVAAVAAVQSYANKIQRETPKLQTQTGGQQKNKAGTQKRVQPAERGGN